MKKDYRQSVNFGIRIISAFLAVLTVYVTGRFAYVVFAPNTGYRENASKSQWSSTELTALRGNIYDSEGNVLAKSAFVWKFYVIPKNFKYISDKSPNEPINESFKQQFCRDLSAVIDIEYEELLQKCTLEYSSTETVKDENGNETPKLLTPERVYIKSKVEIDEKEKIEAALRNEEGEKKAYIQEVKTEKGSWKKKFSYTQVCGFETDIKRYYPYSTFASNLIGMVEADDNSVGQTGIEAYYNTDLKGVNGRKTSYGSRTDDSGSVYEAINGNNLYLTIDSSIQYALDEQLKAVYKSSGGIGAYGIVMDVDTGAVLAMDGVGYKGNYDLNNRYALNDYYSKSLERELQKEEEDCRYLSKADIESLDKIENPEERENTKRSIIKKNMQTGMWNNYCVSELYYPGSVFKPFLAAAAVEEQVLGDDYTFCCNGQIAIEDRVFHCHQLRGHGWQNLKEGLMNSCNPFFISVGRKLGREKFFNYFEAFGFTEKTGIDILSEEGGSTVNYYTVDKLGAVELASESFGQSFRITPVQMITALSAIANGGKLMKPYIVAKQTDSQGNVINETTPVVKRQVISESTAEQVGEMMEAVVTGGTGRNGYVAGYRVAGKTGTTQKENMKGLYIASFGCFAPVDDPKIAVLIIVNEPQGEINGSTVCAPVAAKVVEQTLEYLGVEREYTEKELEKLDTQTPGLIGMDVSAAKEKLEKNGFKFKVVGEGDTVVGQNPAGGHTIPQHGAVVIYTESDSEEKMVMVPDFNTMTPNRAKSYALEEGLNIKIVGNTTGTVYAYDQSIPAETEVEYGSTVTVYFKTTTGVNDFAG